MTDYSDVFDDAEARSNVGSAAGVAPPHAVSAFKSAPVTGVAPSVGMADPESGKALAQQERDAALLGVPAIRAFAARSPAHVAATKEDWPSLAKVAATVWNDFSAPPHAAGQKLGQDLVEFYKRSANPAPPKLTDLIPGFSPQDRAAGSIVGDVFSVLGSGFAGVANVVARPLSYIPGGAKWVPGKGAVPMTQEESQADITNMLLTGLAGIKPTFRGTRVVRPVDLGKATVVPDAPIPGQPRLPGRPGVVPEDTPVYTHVAAADAALSAEVEAAIAETKTHSELPTLTKEFLEHTDAGGKSVWVDPTAILKLYAEGHTPFPAYSVEIGAALNAGRDVQLPLPDYWADVSGKPYAEALRAATRFREEGVSVEEGKALGETLTQEPVNTASEGETVAPAPQEFTPPEDLIEHAEPLRELAARAEGATEEVFAEQALRGLFDPKALKLSEGRFARYDAMLAEAKAATSERILQRAYNAIRRERTPEWRAEVERALPGITAAIQARPEVAAFDLLTKPGYKIDRETAEAVFPASFNRLPATMFKKDGNHPDDVAEQLGFSSGAEMLDTLAALADAKGDRTLAQFVKDEARAGAEGDVRRATGLDISPEGLLAAAREEAVLPQVEDFLSENLRELAAEAGLPFDAGALEYQAQLDFDALPVRVASKPFSFERGMWRTGEAALKAMEKGDWPAAFKARQLQLLNFHQLKMSHFLAKKVAQAEKKFRRLSRDATIKGLSQPFLDQLHAYLPQWGYGSPRNEAELAEALGGKTLFEFVDETQVANAAFPGVPEVQAAPLKDLSVDNFWKVRHFVFAMDKYGRELQKARGEGRREAFSEQREAALASVPPGKPPKKLTADKEGDGLKERFLHEIRSYDAMHRKPADMVEWLDRGDPLGIWHQSIIAPLYEGANAEGRLHREIYEPVVREWEKIPSAVKRGYSTVLPSPFTSGGRPLEVYRRNVLTLALYTGAEEPLQKASAGLGVDPATLLEWVNSHITPEEVNLVELVWAKFEELAPQVSEVLRRQTGEGLRRIEPVAVELGGRTLRGGYVPVEYDSRSSLNPAVAEWEAEKLAVLNPDGLDYVLGDVLPNRGFSKEHTNFVGVVNMELGRLTRLFNSHIKYAAYAQPISDVRKFVFDPLIAEVITQKFGPEYLNVIPEWLNGIVTPLQSADRNLRWWDSFAERVGRNMTTATLAGSYGTLVAQAAGWLNGVAVLSEGNILRGAAAMVGGTKDTLGALAQTKLPSRLGEPLEFQGFQRMFAASEMMRQRYGSLEQNMTEALAEADAIAVRGGYKQAIQHLERVLFHWIGWAEFVSASGPIWFAAEKQALARGMRAADAVKFADRKVVKSQGSGRRVDQSAVQRARGLMKLMYAYQSYFNQQYQLTVDLYRNVVGRELESAGGGGGQLPPEGGVLGADGEEPPEVAKARRYGLAQFAISAVTVFMLQGVVANWLSERKNKLTDPLTNFLRPMFLLNSIAYNVDKHIHVGKEGISWKGRTGDYGLGDDQLSRALEIIGQNLYNLATVGKTTKTGKPKKLDRPVQALIQLPTLAVRLPGANALARAAEYLNEVRLGQQRPRDGKEWTDVMSGLKFGPRPAQNTATKKGGAAVAPPLIS